MERRFEPYPISDQLLMTLAMSRRVLTASILVACLWLMPAGCALHASIQPTAAPASLAQTAAHVPASSSLSGGRSRSIPPRHVSSLIHFKDVAAGAGIQYRWTISGSRPINALQGIGNGCAFLDYNNDGNLDILLVGPKLALYQGDGHGHFTDVTHATGLDKLHGHFLGVAVGDYDNDGYDDLYLSGYQTGILLHNEANLTSTSSPRDPLRGRRGEFERSPFPGSEASVLGKGTRGLGQRVFRDVTKQMGLEAQPWGTSCAFADVDGDGYLDLFVCNYFEFGPKTPQLCQVKGVMTACGPHVYHGLHGVLYHNLAGRQFEDVTELWGAKATGNDLGVAFADFEGTGRIGFAIANDELGGDLFENEGAGRLQNINVKSGTWCDKNSKVHGGMGVDWGDVDNDGKLDFLVTTFQNQAKCLYHNEGNGLFTEISDVIGINNPTFADVAWGCKFLDADNDGWLDLLIANGHVQDNIARIDKSATYRQATQFFHNLGGNPVYFADESRSAGPDLKRPLVGRGLAVGDFDNDGRMDALIVVGEGAPLLLHNETRNAGHWIGFRLIGSGRSNRDAYGAMVQVTAGGRTLLRQCHADGSYLSSSDARVHFGLGSAATVDHVQVRWPDGKVQTWPHLPTGRYITLIEGR